MASIMELRDAVKARGKVSLIELANEYRMPKERVEAMMQRVVDKGQVETWIPREASACGCGGKCACGTLHGPVRFYRWVG